MKLGGQGITLMSKMSEADRRINEQMLEEARCHTWRLMLLEQQIEELNEVILTALHNGTPRTVLDRAHDLLSDAQNCCDNGELDYAENVLRKAELEVIAVKKQERL